jgi:hypothetical protein
LYGSAGKWLKAVCVQCSDFSPQVMSLRPQHGAFNRSSVIAAHALSARRREFLSALMETLLLRKALKEKDRKIKYAFLPSIYMDAMKNVPVASIFCLERARADRFKINRGTEIRF